MSATYNKVDQTREALRIAMLRKQNPHAWQHGPRFLTLNELVSRSAKRARARVTHRGKR